MSNFDEIDEEVFEKREHKPIIDFKNKKNLTIFLIVVAMIILIILEKTLGIFSGLIYINAGMGNTVGNILNYGYAVEKDDYIYYVRPSEDMEKTSIYRMKKGTQDGEKIFDGSDTICSLNIVGNYLYFMDISSEQRSDEDGVDNKIYKVKLDGSDAKIINDNEFMCGYTNLMFTVKNQIYYIGTDYNVYKMDLNGQNKKLVLEADAGFLSMNEKYIIYNKTDEENNGYITYICSIDGSNERPVNGSWIYTPQIYEDYIYYVNGDYNIIKMNVNGKEEETVYDGEAYYVNIYNGQIYFLSFKDANSQDTVSMFKISTDGGEPENIKDFSYGSDFVDVVGEYICYRDMDDKQSFINLLNVNDLSKTELYSWKYDQTTNSTGDEISIDDLTE